MGTEKFYGERKLRDVRHHVKVRNKVAHQRQMGHETGFWEEGQGKHHGHVCVHDCGFFGARGRGCSFQTDEHDGRAGGRVDDYDHGGGGHVDGAVHL